MEAIDPRSGFNPVTKTYHSLRPPVDLPPETLPLSTAAYVFSLRRSSPWPDSAALIDSATGQRVSYSEFTHRTETLAANLRTAIGLSKGDKAFVLSPNSAQVPILYFALLANGVVISPANPISTASEIARLIQLSKPTVAFSTSAAAYKLPKSCSSSLIKIVLIDLPEFDSLTRTKRTSSTREVDRVEVSQSDLAAIMYSSGTTGKVKGVMLTHRNMIAVVGESHAQAMRTEKKSPGVFLYTVPFFHMYGFSHFAKSIAVGDTVVMMERFEMRKMLRAVEDFNVTNVALAPPILVAMAKGQLTVHSSLASVACGGSALRKEVIAAFKARFPNVSLAQGYGLTESAGAIFKQLDPEEIIRWGSSGRISKVYEAKIVDPETGEALPPGKQGELWIRGPSIMKGYIGDEEATSAAIVEGGWLRTGDLCYIDEEGLLYVVDRLKELIKYKGYQVAPTELEQLLQSHPEILDAAVIPYPDEEAGQIPMAIVVRQPKTTVSESEVMKFVAKQVAPYKKIRRVAFVDSIPKNAAGKILRKELIKSSIPGTLLSRL